MQLYTLSEPIYGPESYTTVGKNIELPIVHEPEKNQEGSGLDESPNSSETSESSSIKEKSPENDVLNKLNEKTM